MSEKIVAVIYESSALLSNWLEERPELIVSLLNNRAVGPDGTKYLFYSTYQCEDVKKENGFNTVILLETLRKA